MMTKYEKLLSEYEDRVSVYEKPSLIDGFIIDDCILINTHLTESEKLRILAEELGHYETSVGDLTFLDSIPKLKQEYRARKWGIEKICPYSTIQTAISNGCSNVYELSEELDLSVNFLNEALRYYNFI